MIYNVFSLSKIIKKNHFLNFSKYPLTERIWSWMVKIWVGDGSRVELYLLVRVQMAWSWRHKSGKASHIICHKVAWVRERYHPCTSPLTPGHLLKTGKANPGDMKVEMLILLLSSSSTWVTGSFTFSRQHSWLNPLMGHRWSSNMNFHWRFG